MARINCHGASGLKFSFVNPGQHFLLRPLGTFPRRARNPQRIEIFPVTVLGQIALVQHDNLVGIAVAIFENAGLRVPIRDVQSQVGQLQRFLRARTIPFTLELAAGYSQTRRIEQTNGNAVQIDAFLDGVACRAVRIAHNHAIVTEEPIEQARFPGIGCSVNHHRTPSRRMRP